MREIGQLAYDEVTRLPVCFLQAPLKAHVGNGRRQDSTGAAAGV